MDNIYSSTEFEMLKFYCERFSRIPVAFLDNQGIITDSNSWFRHMCGLKSIPVGSDISTILEIAEKPVFSSVFTKSEDLEALHFSARPRAKKPALDYQGIVIRYGHMQMIFFRNKLDDSEKVLSTVTELNIDISSLARDLAKKNQQLLKANKRVADLLDSDTLTGIRNRRYISNAIERLMSYRNRHQTPCFSLIMFDIDHFKRVNDLYGHDLGDKVLINVTELFTGILRQEDTLARFGGEEFIIILVNQNLNQAFIVAEKLRKALEIQPMPHGEKITASFGVAHCRADDTKEALLKRADDAMYSAKKRGRNCAVLETDITVLE